jgi:drug/metabolite transporter (DMT)-like permease
VHELVPPAALLAALGTAVCFAQATVLVRRFPPVHPVTMNAVGMTAGAALLVAGSLLADEPLALPRHPATWAALGYLVVVGSMLVFVLYLVVLRSWSASRAAYVFVLIPFVTVAVSAWLDHEPVGARLALGGLLVLAGVYIGALRPARTPPTPPAVPVPANAAGAMRATGAQPNVAGRAVSEPMDAEGGRRWTTSTAGS